MAVARALRRLLRVLELEEEQAQGALEGALGELRRLEQARSLTLARERRGRAWVAASASSGRLADRLAGIEEARAARHLVGVLAERIAEAERGVAARREEYLAKRVERRQAETLIGEAEARAAAVSGRRSQQSLDEWFLNRGRTGAHAGQSRERVSACEDARPAARKT